MPCFRDFRLGESVSDRVYRIKYTDQMFANGAGMNRFRLQLRGTWDIDYDRQYIEFSDAYSAILFKLRWLS